MQWALRITNKRYKLNSIQKTLLGGDALYAQIEWSKVNLHHVTSVWYLRGMSYYTGYEVALPEAQSTAMGS